MKSLLRFLFRVILPAAALAALSACNFELANSIQGTPQFIIATATNQPGTSETPGQPPSTPEPGSTQTATLTATPTSTPTSTPTNTPTSTIALPTMIAGQDLSCVKGPHWILYEWVAPISEGETVTLLAKAPEEWEDYYYVHKSNGTECWAFGGSSTITGDTSTLPVREAPPLPTITYTITNKMLLPIVDLYIRQKDEVAWGADRLGAGNIAPGATFSLTFTAGFYDVQMKDSLGGILYEKDNTPIGPEPSSSVIILDNRYPMVFRNNTVNNVCRVAVRAYYGGSITNLSIPGDGIIAPGEEVTLEMTAGYYDAFVYRCGDYLLIFSAGAVYFGPLSGTLVIS
jgi:hypothetical protein